MKKLIDYLNEIYLQPNKWYQSNEKIAGLSITKEPMMFVKEDSENLVFKNKKGDTIRVPAENYDSFSEVMTEELDKDDISRIKNIIKGEVSKMFFNLFKTRNIWGSMK